MRVRAKLSRLVSSRLVWSGLVWSGLVWSLGGSASCCRLLRCRSMPCRVLIGRIVPTPHGPKWERAHVGARLSGNGRRYGRIRLGTNEVGFEESVSFPMVRCNMLQHVAPSRDTSQHVAACRDMLHRHATCCTRCDMSRHVAPCIAQHVATQRTAPPGRAVRLPLRCCRRSTAAEPARAESAGRLRACAVCSRSPQ